MWLKRKNVEKQELLSRIDDINQKLQQVVEENKKLQNDVRELQREVKKKESLLAQAQAQKKYKVLDGMLLSDEQSAVVDLLEYTNDCYFITGKAGTGKSTILKYFISHTGKKVVALAPTGIAANIINGRTIHSFFGLSLTLQDIKNKKAVNSELNAEPKLIEELDAIIIDEASMIRSDVMDMIDHKLRVAKDKPSPYGGVQMILFGDLFQLPPVVKETEAQVIQTRYETPYFFGAPSAEKSFVVCGLTQVFRQTDASFIRILNKIREGTVSQAELRELYQCCGNTSATKKSDMYIVPTNKKASEINKERLSHLETEEYTYHAIIEGDAKEEDTPTSERITLKVGATVMMLCNDKDKYYINGTLATVVDLGEDMIKVRIAGVGIIDVDRYTWTKYQYVYNEEEDKIESQETGSFTQYPLKLAYAITVHKSQGQTFEHATIDFEKTGAFAPGQTYVALSRCRRLEDIHLAAPIGKKDIIVSNEAIRYIKDKGVPALQYAREHLQH